MNERRHLDTDTRLELRETFDAVAELYHRVRPGYPAALFTDLIAMTGTTLPSRMLEIGCGTGQATLPLAERGFAITAVEMGNSLAAVGRRILEPFPQVQVVTANFEEWQHPDEPFDLVLAATSFHWLTPQNRAEQVAMCLAPGGYLGVIDTQHVSGGDQQFFDEMQECYVRWMPGTEPGFRVPEPGSIIPTYDDITSSGLFHTPQFRLYLWTERYGSATFTDLLSTYSNHRALDGANREGLLTCIASLINDGFNGTIEKQYQTTLMVAQKR